MRPVPERGIALIKRFESCELQAYRDVAGVWTIGWGNTRHAKAGLAIDAARADAWLAEDLATVAREIAAALRADILDRLSDDQYGALCSFAFNLGVRPKAHAIWALINSGQFDRVPARLLLYNKAVIGGKPTPVAGLSRRRRAEAAMWQDDGDEVILTARLADVQPTPILSRRLGRSKRLWLGFTAALAGFGQWFSEHAALAGEWARQLQTIVAPQVSHSTFLAQVSGALAIVAVGAGAAVMIFQARAHKDSKA